MTMKKFLILVIILALPFSAIDMSAQRKKTQSRTSQLLKMRSDYLKSLEENPESVDVVNVESCQDAPIFLGIPVKGPIEDMIDALKARGFKDSKVSNSLLMGEFKGLPCKIHVMDSKATDHVVHIQIQPQLNSAGYFDSDGVKKRFNELIDDYGSDSRYVAFSWNKKISQKEDVAYQMRVNDKEYRAKFYEGGDKKKIVAIAIHEYEGKYYVAIHYYNCYYSTLNYDEWS